MFILSCKENPPLKEDKFLRVYVDLISFPDTLFDKQDLFEKYKENVFKSHGVSKNDYKKMVDYYNSNPELWEEFFQKVIKYIDSQPDSFFIR
ncbi:MAG: DUF4296 domain-containing protein [Ignavibacterium sp.]|nr:DUF4296 domain-containing protein [Ignavibacterium sp.]MDW8375123.1 DUF4296 domain-containing protein [Ignavibacteriales bacterium]